MLLNLCASATASAPRTVMICVIGHHIDAPKHTSALPLHRGNATGRTACERTTDIVKVNTVQYEALEFQKGIRTTALPCRSLRIHGTVDPNLSYRHAALALPGS